MLSLLIKKYIPVKISVFTISLFFFTSTTIFASPSIEILTSINTMEAFIGEYINYNIIIISEDNIKYAFDDLEFKYPQDEVQIISSTTNTKKEKGYRKTTYNYTVAFYKHGIYDMPTFAVEYFKNNDEHNVLKSTTTYVSIKPLTDGQYLPPIKNNEKLTIPFYVYIVGSIVIIIIIASIIYLLFIIAKRKAKGINIYEPEDIKALKELKDLDNKMNLKKLSATQYYFSLTQIYKKYLTDRFELPILEMTTTDIKKHINEKMIPNYKDIITFLNYSDYIKFAKLYSDTEDSSRDIQFCEKYIKKYGSKEKELEERKEKEEQKEKQQRQKNKK